MTYTVIARCGRTGQLGIGIATYSLAVGGYCPAIRGGLGAVSTQAFVNLKLGTLALRLLDLGFGPGKAMAELLADGEARLDLSAFDPSRLAVLREVEVE